MATFPFTYSQCIFQRFGFHVVTHDTGTLCMEITYTLVGDYYRPNLVAPESPKVGRWGMLRFNYLRKHREALYTIMLMENTLNPHLEEIDRQAQEMEQQLISQLAQQEGITEQLKAENQMEWVARMNNIRNRADEIVLNDLIYA